MFAEERQNLILSLINSKGAVKISQLEKEFDVSKMTLWRDLKSLDDKGLIKKVYGGAVKIDIIPPNEPTFEEKASSAIEEKRAIAKYAAKQFIHKGEVISLGAGSTLLQMVPYLTQKNLTILTSGLDTMMHVANYHPHINLMVCGGMVRQPAKALVGPEAEQFFRRNKADTAFLSASGITIKDGITDPHPLDIQVKKEMIKSAKRVIFLMDSHKVGKRLMATTIPLDEIDMLLMDEGTPSSFIEALNSLRILNKLVKI